MFSRDAASLCLYTPICGTVSRFAAQKLLPCKVVRDKDGLLPVNLQIPVVGGNSKVVSQIVASSVTKVESVTDELPQSSPEVEALKLSLQDLELAPQNLDPLAAPLLSPNEALRPPPDADGSASSLQESFIESSDTETSKMQKQGLVAGRKPKKIWRGPCRPKRSLPKPPWSKEYCKAKELAMVEALLLNEREAKVSVGCILDPWVGKITRVELSNVLRALGGQDKESLALEVFNWMKKQRCRLKPNGRICSLILGVLGRAGLVSKAREVFEFSQVKTADVVYFYNAMMAAFIQGGKYKKAWRLYQKMVCEGIVPDEVTFNTLMMAAVQANLPVAKAENLFARMKERGIKPSVRTFNTLISALAKQGHHQKVQGLLEEMKLVSVQPDLVTFNTLIHIYAKTGKYRKAMNTLKALKASGFRPNTVTFTGIIQALSRRGKHQEAVDVFHEMPEAGCIPDLRTYSLLVDVHGRAGFVAEAEKIFVEMQKAGYKPNLVTWSSMIQAYSRQGLLDKAALLLQQMQSSGCVGDVSLFNILIGAYARIGMTASAADLFRRMQLSGVFPNGVTYSIILASFVRSGQQKEAKVMQGLMIRAGYSANGSCNFQL
ncbi:hypothetical protein O6H91_06G139100 [Diphasiastrum complanatum]|uniref:Uncharacterized protein n=3 Tax=Diphasiastrum complanatum TaxID=34168 RepID=A0ACC2DJH2_DIPCM|nr:hypothetical protein O6H91_06G139100 [Diphasiastrum complanatum]